MVDSTRTGIQGDVVYSAPGLAVSDAAVEIHGVAYPLADIDSVAIETLEAKAQRAKDFAAVGAIITATGFMMFLAGASLISTLTLIAGAIIFTASLAAAKEHALMVRTTGGGMAALESRNIAELQRAKTAIENALAPLN